LKGGGEEEKKKNTAKFTGERLDEGKFGDIRAGNSQERGSVGREARKKRVKWGIKAQKGKVHLQE